MAWKGVKITEYSLNCYVFVTSLEKLQLVILNIVIGITCTDIKDQKIQFQRQKRSLYALFINK